MMITIFNKLRIITEIKNQQEMNFFWIIRTAQIIMDNKLIERRRRRFNENKIIKILFLHFFLLLFISSLF